jgi:sigma-B regulation protein RsbU (phosphoserine phosphatase)
MMPDMDGFEVCRTLKARPETAGIVVIFLSALGEVRDKVAGLKLGAADYVTKPIQAEEVLARVENHLARQFLERELRRSRDRLDRELESAAAMQRQILPPRMPDHPNVEFAAYYRTSRHAGGDYYDVLDRGAGVFGLMVSDVSGHGAPAAIVMAMIRAVLHSHPSPDDPSAVLRHLNQHFRYLWDTAMFATAVYGVLDAGARQLRIALAGHPPPLLVREGDPVGPLALDAVPALLFAEIASVPCARVALQPGDRLLFYTDGATDRFSPGGEMYDVDRLMARLDTGRSLAPAALVRHVVDDIDAFAAGHEPEDDQTLLLLGIR